MTSRPYLPLFLGTPSSFGVEQPTSGTVDFAGVAGRELRAKVVNDLRDVQTRMYMNNLMVPLRKWLNENYDIKLRAQISYGKNLEISQPIEVVDYPETETRNQRDQTDIYRVWAGGAHLQNKVLSSETDAHDKMNYGFSLQEFLQQVYSELAGGGSRVIWHGYASTWGPQGSVRWPGYAAAGARAIRPRGITASTTTTSAGCRPFCARACLKSIWRFFTATTPPAPEALVRARRDAQGPQAADPPGLAVAGPDAPGRRLHLRLLRCSRWATNGATLTEGPYFDNQSRNYLFDHVKTYFDNGLPQAVLKPYVDAPVYAETSASAPVGGSVPATLSLSLGAPATFSAFTPGVAHDYTASTTANVISTAGEATLSVSDPGHLANGAFSLPEPLRVEFSKSSWTGPVSNDPVDITFRQHIGANDPLRTGSYTKTLTFTLSTTNP
jgi:hypothetical protein